MIGGAGIDVSYLLDLLRHGGDAGAVWLVRPPSTLGLLRGAGFGHTKIQGLPVRGLPVRGLPATAA